MRKFLVLVKIQAFAATGFLALFAFTGTPALSQDGDPDAETVVETTEVESVEAEAPTEPAPVAISAGDPEISTLQLQLLLNPLTTDELTVEADAWLLSLRQRVQSISELELAIEQENDIIKARQAIESELETAQKNGAPKTDIDDIQRQITKLDTQAVSAQSDPRFREIFAAAKSNYAIVTGEDLVTQAKGRLSSVEEGAKADKASTLIVDLEAALGSYEAANKKLEEQPFFSDLRRDKARELVKDRQNRVTRAYNVLENSPLFDPKLGNANVQEEIRDQLIAQATVLEASRSNLVTRVQLVLDELEKKGGDIDSYDRYIKAISGLDFDVTDAQGVRVRFMTWLQSEDGGIKLGLGLLKFGGILVAAFVIAPRAGKISNKILKKVDGMSTLFREFAVMSIERSILGVGALLALAALGVNLGPILAVVGGASFVLAFALQSNLGNFASGLMLLISKPFDVGDEVKVAGYWAYVDSISLASTKLKDFAGSIITLPNNTVWGGDIINYTHTDIRKISIGIHAKFTQDVDELQDLWLSVARANPKVLKDPGPSIFPYSSTYDYKMWVGLAAWSKTPDYWGVYVELLKAFQAKLEEHNIELAAPLQKIKVDSSSDGASSDATEVDLPDSVNFYTTEGITG